MKKIIFISLFTLLLTGCTVNYDLEFKGESLYENISFKDNDIFSDIYTEQYAILDGIGSEKYDYSFKDNTHNYSYKYDLKDYNRSKILGECYENVAFVKDEDKYIFTTSDAFKCFVYEYRTVDQVNISIKTDHEVISSNADKVNKNTYIWKINKDNKTNKPIKIVFGKQKKTLFSLLSENILLSFVVIVSIIGGIITLIVYLISKKNNRI